MTELSDSVGAGQVELPESIRCLLVPLRGATLLVPNSLIAEVVRGRLAENDYADPHRATFTWRGVAVPLVPFEPLLGLEQPPESSDVVAIFNSSSGDPRLPFFAVAVQGIPRSVRITATSLATTGDPCGDDAIAFAAVLEGEPVLIPDTVRLEARLLDAGRCDGEGQ